MTELRPLRECSDDELELALLGAASSDAPTPSGLRDAALALGLTAATAHTIAATLPATIAGSAGSSVATAPLASSSALAGAAGSGVALGGAALGTVAKSLLGGALLSFVALTAVDHTLNRAPAASSVRAPSAVTVSAAEPAEVTPAVASPANPEPSPPAAATATPRPASAANPLLPMAASEPVSVALPEKSSAPTSAAFAPLASAKATEAPPSPSSLTAEIRLLDRARAALAAGDAGGAAQALDAYAASRPSGVLTQEATVLRVRLLIARGQRAEAVELARRSVAQHPESAQADLLRQLANAP